MEKGKSANGQAPVENKKGHGKKSFRRKLILGAGAFIIVVAVLVTAFWFLFRISSFSVIGSVPYTSQQVIEATGLKSGTNIYFADYGKAGDSAKFLLPYIGKIEFRKKFPAKVVITVTKAVPAFSVKAADSLFVLADKDLKALEVVAEPAEGTVNVATAAGGIKYEPGKKIEFITQGTEDLYRKALSEIKELEDEFSSKINLIGLEDEDNIYLIYDNRLVIRTGSLDDFSNKLTLAQKAINEENKLSSTQFGELDVRVAGKAVFAPKDYKDMTELILFLEGSLPEEETENEDEEVETAEGEDETEASEEDETSVSGDNTEETDENVSEEDYSGENSNSEDEEQ
ncbi:MAG: FtsQ-type POTRA domain-containing protein [Clostridia bacterium]|nr:FtsQ-type POTRA domain-containing protein [Clostridia bacterium]